MPAAAHLLSWLLLASASTGFLVSSPPSCSTSASYTSMSGGVRRVRLPPASCVDMTASEKDQTRSLCCANTHVTCGVGQLEPELTSYDGRVFRLRGSDTASWLADAYTRVCAMPMARRHGDCNLDHLNIGELHPVVPDSKMSIEADIEDEDGKFLCFVL